jgi:hypothetical protein
LQRDVIATVRRRAEALAQQDWATVAEHLHPRFTYVNAQGMRLDRDEYLAFVRDGPLRWVEQRLEDVSVIVAGSTAVLVATVYDDVLVDGEPHELSWVSTQTYVEEGGRWLYVAGQTGPRPTN